MGTRKGSLEIFHGNLIQIQINFCRFHLRYRPRLREIHASLLRCREKFGKSGGEKHILAIIVENAMCPIKDT